MYPSRDANWLSGKMQTVLPMADEDGSGTGCGNEQQSRGNKHRHFLTNEAVEEPADDGTQKRREHDNGRKRFGEARRGVRIS